MLRKNILLALRNIAKRKAFTMINILGLTVGMTVCLLILTYARYQMSYDTNHANADKIYRVSVDFYQGDAFQVADAQCFPGAGPFAVAEFPEIDDYAMLRERGKFVIKYGDKAFNEDKVYLANTSWLTMFDWNLVRGNRATALRDPHMIVISESMAKKYFGDENPMGKMLSVIPGEEELQMMVNGVFKDVPPNSHVHFDALISYETRVQTSGWKYDDWRSNNEFMYLLSNQVNLTADFENKLNELYHSKIGPFSERGNKLKIQALTDIHLKSDKTYEAQPNGSQRIVNILIVVALFVLVVAWVNYINLSTARAMERGKEVGVRKVLGSGKGALVRQFLIEAAFLNLISIVLTITSVQLALPFFNQLAGLELSVSILTSANGLIQVLMIFVVGTVASGLYPALVLSNFKPLSVLSGKVKDSQSGRMLRKGLVVFQFLITMLLLIGTMTIYQQVAHMRSQKLGVNLDQTIVVAAPIVAEGNSSQIEKRKAFKTELTRLPEVGAIAFTETVFGQGTNEMNSTTGIYRVGDEQGKGVNFYFYRVDDQFLQTFDFQMLAGRPFQKELETPYEDDPGQSKGMIVNETSRKIMGFASNEAAIGKQVNRNGRIFNIIGVINDYNHHSLKRALDPIVLFYDRTGRSVGYTSIKVKAGEGKGYKKALSGIEAVYRKIFPDSDFSYHFLDEKFDEQYQADQQFGQVFSAFALITIFVSILGLFGLALYEIQQRIKEIGIRKVLGATIPAIIGLLSKDFMKLIVISVLLALPIAWWGIDSWLNTYAYRIDLSWYLFALPALVLLLVAMVTIMGQTLKVAKGNPVDALRYE